MSLEQFGEGAQRAFVEAVIGVALAGVIGILAASSLVPDSLKWVFALVAALPLISLLQEIRLWSIIYTAGWTFGVLLMNNSGIIPLYEVVLFIAVPSAIWGIRLYIWLHDNGHL